MSREKVGDGETLTEGESLAYVEQLKQEAYAGSGIRTCMDMVCRHGTAGKADALYSYNLQ